MEAGSQKRAPVYEALEQLKREESFLSMCRGTREAWQPELVELLGEKCESGCEFHEAA